MMKRTVPVLATLWPIWLKKSFVNLSTSRAFSNQIIMSPSLLSLDLADSWFSSSKNSDHSSNQECHVTSGNERTRSAPELCSKKWTSKIIDGNAIAEGIRSRITSEVSRMKELTGQVPGLAVILVGERRDSLTYVRKKQAASEEVGMKFKLASFPENCTEREVCNALCNFNEDPSIHGILLQLPLPQHLDEAKILNCISLEKDVDGFHPLNIGTLAMQGMEPLFIPCTPKGCIELLLQSGVQISGKRAVVIGKSNIVGLPLSLLLQRHHATVSIIHAFTKNPEEITREADILVTAAGVPNLIRDSWLKPGAIVIDVGTTPVEDPSSEHGYRLTGDVCFTEATRVASAITPVPGGVGPMTVAMLLCNTLESAKRALRVS